MVHRDRLYVARALEQRVDELDIAVTAQAENVGHLLPDQIIDNDLGSIQNIARGHRCILLCELLAIVATCEQRSMRPRECLHVRGIANCARRSGVPAASSRRTLVPRTRSSHDLAAGAFANFGFKSGTRIIEFLVSLDSEVRIRTRCNLVRTSE